MTPEQQVWLQALQAAPEQFNFLHMLRQWECVHHSLPRLGQTSRPMQETLRLAQQPALSFAPATIAAFQPAQNAQMARLTVYFLGLFGPNGPLPLHLTEYARDRERNSDDATLTRFADLFHHRILTLFYRAWAAARPTVSFDRPETDRFGIYLAALFGQGMPSLNDRDALPDNAKRHYAGRLVAQTRHPEGLAAILTDFLQLPVRIEEFVGHWLELPTSTQWQLGVSHATGSLGHTAIIGTRIWDRQCKFRLHFGPLRLADYRRLLPGGATLPKVIAIVRNYMGDEWAWDMRMVLCRSETPPLQLGGHNQSGWQLGWTTWLISQTPATDPADLTLRPPPQLISAATH